MSRLKSISGIPQISVARRLDARFGPEAAVHHPALTNHLGLDQFVRNHQPTASIANNLVGHSINLMGDSKFARASKKSEKISPRDQAGIRLQQAASAYMRSGSKDHYNKFEKLFSKNKDQLIGKHFTDLVSRP